MSDALLEAGATARALVTVFDTDTASIVGMIEELDRDQLEMVVFALSGMASQLIRGVATARGVDLGEYRQRLFAQIAYRGAEAAAEASPPTPSLVLPAAVTAPLPPVVGLLLRGWPRVTFGWPWLRIGGP